MSLVSFVSLFSYCFPSAANSQIIPIILAPVRGCECRPRSERFLRRCSFVVWCTKKSRLSLTGCCCAVRDNPISFFPTLGLALSSTPCCPGALNPKRLQRVNSNVAFPLRFLLWYFRLLLWYNVSLDSTTSTSKPQPQQQQHQQQQVQNSDDNLETTTAPRPQAARPHPANATESKNGD